MNKHVLLESGLLCNTLFVEFVAEADLFGTTKPLPEAVQKLICDRIKNNHVDIGDILKLWSHSDTIEFVLEHQNDARFIGKAILSSTTGYDEEAIMNFIDFINVNSADAWQEGVITLMEPSDWKRLSIDSTQYFEEKDEELSQIDLDLTLISINNVNVKIDTSANEYEQEEKLAQKILESC